MISMTDEAMWDMVLIGNIIIFVLSFFPMILNYRYYRKTRIIDYLLVSSYFGCWAIICSFSLLYDGFLFHLSRGKELLVILLLSI